MLKVTPTFQDGFAVGPTLSYYLLDLGCAQLMMLFHQKLSIHWDPLQVESCFVNGVKFFAAGSMTLLP